MTAALIRAYTTGVLRASAAYYADRTSVIAAAPKTDRKVGSGIGRCHRCGDDVTNLVKNMCDTCQSYLWRRANPVLLPHTCPDCGKSHNQHGQTCNSCRARKFRAKKKEARS